VDCVARWDLSDLGVFERLNRYVSLIVRHFWIDTPVPYRSNAGACTEVVLRMALRRLQFSRTLKGMEVHFTPEQEAQLAKVATIKGTDPERLVKNAALRVIEDTQFRAAVREGIAQADHGEFIEEEEMNARFEEMLRS